MLTLRLPLKGLKEKKYFVNFSLHVSTYYLNLYSVSKKMEGVQGC